MPDIFVPNWVVKHNFYYGGADEVSEEQIMNLRTKLKKFNTDNPEVSIVIPAYNEEKIILKTLSSLADLKTSYNVELIVANNNSTDKTQQLLDLCGVKSVFVRQQGISYARQAGLEMAKGRYIVSADSDTIYPPQWLDKMVERLKQTKISCVYGPYSFIPDKENPRPMLALYETAAALMFKLKKKNRECVNVMGFNFAFRKEDAVAIGGYNHDLKREVTLRSEDGWMAMCLMQKGELYRMQSKQGRVWTSYRRLMDDGSIVNAFAKRAEKELKRLGLYLFPKGVVNVKEEIQNNN